MRLTTLLLIALACAPGTRAWFGGSPFGMVPHVSFNDLDDPFDGFLGMPRHTGARSILRDADRTFRRLDNMINTIAQVADEADSSRPVSRLRVAEKERGDKNETAITTKSNIELRLRPTFEWKETDDGFLLTGAMPGLKKEELSVEVVDSPHRGGGHFLVVSGESRKEHKTEGEQPFEFRAMYKKFEQRVKLPEGVDKNSLHAKYEDGMLQIHVAYPKEERSERKKITIN